MRNATRPKAHADLAVEVAALRAELAELRQQLATEVRTRRLVVVSEEGFEGVTADVGADYAHLSVSCRTLGVDIEGEHLETTSVSLHAEENRGEGSFCELNLVGAGNGYANIGIDEQSEVGPSGIPRLGARLELHQPTDDAGIILDHEGLRLHPMRLYYEKQAQGRRS